MSGLPLYLQIFATKANVTHMSIVGYYIQFIVLIATIVFFVYVLMRGYKQKVQLVKQNENANTKVLTSIFVILLILILRVLVVGFNQLIQYLSNEQYELANKATVQTIVWALLILTFRFLFTGIIKIPKSREGQLKRINRIIDITIVILVVGAGITIIQTDEQAAITGAFITLSATIVMWAVYILINKERTQLSSKLGRARLHAITYGILSVALAFTSTPIIILISIFGNYTETVTLIYFLSIQILNILTGLMFYYSFFIPEYFKKKNELILPVSDLI